MLKSALSPASDTLATLCKSLVASSRTTDKKSSRMLGPILSVLIKELLEDAPPILIKALQTTPGAEALLKEQGLSIPPLITLPMLMDSLP